MHLKSPATIIQQSRPQFFILIVADLPLRLSRYITDTSYYAMQMNAWRHCFPLDHVKLITTEALSSNPEETMADVFRWLGVDDGFLPSNLAERANETPSVLQQVRGQGWVQGFRHSALWNAVGPKVPSALRRAMRGFADRPIERKATDRAPVEHYLRDRQRGQTDELSALLGCSFPEWTTLEGRI